MDCLPQEMWLQIFAMVSCTKSLGCVVRTCHAFNLLATEALVRDICWKSAALALAHLKFWDRNASKTHLVRSVSLTLHVNIPGFCPPEEYSPIFRCIQSFSRLQHISLAGGAVPDILYRTLQLLPSVTQLTIQGTALPDPPPFFPLSYPSTLAPAPIQLTTLAISNLRLPLIATLFFETIDVPLLAHLPQLHTLTLDQLNLDIPTSLAAQLTSLHLHLTGSTQNDIQRSLRAFLAPLSALTHLSIDAPHTNPDTVTLTELHAPPLPALRTLSAPWALVALLAPGAPQLAHIRATSAFAKAGDAVWLLERLRGLAGAGAARSLALRLEAWDDEVLLAAVRCLPQCESLELVYAHWAPSEKFLFDMGIHHLPLMPGLRTLRLLSSGTEPEGGEDTEAEALRRECVHAWTRYNSALRRVQVGCEGQRGRTWVRRGRRWEVDDDVEEDEGIQTTGG
ncbi:hypothetical protein C8R46DRAFT_1194688 [Mycena filopes]|nr:hypothetical protein C8R46DRAFT_1194688 [Mycena filopes]